MQIEISQPGTGGVRCAQVNRGRRLRMTTHETPGSRLAELSGLDVTITANVARAGRVQPR